MYMSSNVNSVKKSGGREGGKNVVIEGAKLPSITTFHTLSLTLYTGAKLPVYSSSDSRVHF
jgi:hypothetical protein